MNEPVANPPNICPRCGAAFLCGSRAGLERCWCAELPPLARLPAETPGCLCPDCLREAMEREATGTGVG